MVVQRRPRIRAATRHLILCLPSRVRRTGSRRANDEAVGRRHPPGGDAFRLMFRGFSAFPLQATAPEGCMAKKAGARTTAGSRKRAAKRELIDTGSDKRYVRRGGAGKFKESDDVGKSLTADRRVKARTKVKSGQGDKGDR